MEKEYPLPDVKKDPVNCVVLAYKVTKGIAYDNRSWDRVHWGRAAKAAKDLLEICGGVRQADTCLVEIAKSFEEKDLSWTLETVVKHAHDWVKRKKGGLNDDASTHRARLFKALSERSGGAGRASESEADQTVSPLVRVFDVVEADDHKRNKDGGAGSNEKAVG